MSTFRIDDLAAADAYRLLVGAVVPRPIAWISCERGDGVRNAAPFSFFNVASRSPMTLAISIGPPADEAKKDKDTLAIIRERGEFVVNIANADLIDAVVATSEEVAVDVDEFALAGLTETRADEIDAPMIAEAPISMECRLREVHEIGTDALVLGHVVRIHVDDEVLGPTGRIEAPRLRPLGRLGGPTFATRCDIVERTPNTN